MTNIHKYFYIFFGVALVALGVSAYSLEERYEKLKADPLKCSQVSKNDAIQEVAQLIDLPQNQVPTVATVNDTTKLQYQPFFKKAAIGDKVLIFTEARKAVLYDPVHKTIKDIAPIYFGSKPSLGYDVNTK